MQKSNTVKAGERTHKIEVIMGDGSETPAVVREAVERKISEMPCERTQRVLQIILPQVDSMMTGVWRILKAHDLITLEYTDGSRESATVPTKRWQEIASNVFSIVGEVQSHRKPISE